MRWNPFRRRAVTDDALPAATYPRRVVKPPGVAVGADRPAPASKHARPREAMDGTAATVAGNRPLAVVPRTTAPPPVARASTIFEYGESESPHLRDVDVDVVDLSDDGAVGVVGESHYQPALRICAGGRAAGHDFDSHLPAVALLVPEPGNPFDRHAVRVDLVHGRGSVTVGYLARDIARRYQPALSEVRRQGRVGRCPARITGGGPGRYHGVYLHVARPDRLFVPARTGVDASFAAVTPSAVRLAADRTCTVTREEGHQEVLARHAHRYTDIDRPGEFVLDFCVAGRGKYRGERVVEVRVGPDRVGELTMAMTNRYAHLVETIQERGALALADGHIERDEQRGYQVVLHMPRDPSRGPRREWFYG